MGRMLNDALMTYNTENQRAEYSVRVNGGSWIIVREAYNLWDVYDPHGELHEIMLGKLWRFIEKSIKKYARWQQQGGKPPKPKQALEPDAPKTVQTKMNLD